MKHRKEDDALQAKKLQAFVKTPELLKWKEFVKEEMPFNIITGDSLQERAFNHILDRISILEDLMHDFASTMTELLQQKQELASEQRFNEPRVSEASGDEGQKPRRGRRKQGDA